MNSAHAYLTMCAASTAVALSVAIGAWERRRSAPAAGPLAFVMFGLACWSGLLAAKSWSAPDHALGTALGLASLVAISLVVAAFYCETRALVDDGWRLRPRTVAWLGVHPVTVFLVALTNPLHHLFAGLGTVGGPPQQAAPPGPLFWVHLGYCFAVLTWCFLHLMRALLRGSNSLMQRQVRSILLAAALPTTGVLIGLVRGRSGTGVPDLTPLFIVLAGLVHYYAVVRQGLLRLLPVARDLVVEHVGDAIFVIDTDDRLVDLNSAARRLADRLHRDLPGNLLGTHAWMVLPRRGRRRSLTDGEHHVDAHDGPLDLDLRISELTDGHEHVLGRVVVARDITELNDQRRRLAEVNLRLTEQLEVIEALRNDLAELAVRDELTGLHNRRYLMRRLEQDLDEARSSARPFSVILLDIDHFKTVNDRFGHAVGDVLLVATSAALQGCLRVGDTVARFGGEEFVVLLPDASMAEALHMAEVLRTRCATVRVDGRGSPVSTTVSAGVATFPDCGWSGSELLGNADEALYAAKHAGRDRVMGAQVA